MSQDADQIKWWGAESQNVPLGFTALDRFVEQCAPSQGESWWEDSEIDPLGSPSVGMPPAGMYNSTSSIQHPETGINAYSTTKTETYGQSCPESSSAVSHSISHSHSGYMQGPENSESAPTTGANVSVSHTMPNSYHTTMYTSSTSNVFGGNALAFDSQQSRNSALSPTESPSSGVGQTLSGPRMHQEMPSTPPMIPASGRRYVPTIPNKLTQHRKWEEIEDALLVFYYDRLESNPQPGNNLWQSISMAMQAWMEMQKIHNWGRRGDEGCRSRYLKLKKHYGLLDYYRRLYSKVVTNPAALQKHLDKVPRMLAPCVALADSQPVVSSGSLQQYGQAQSTENSGQSHQGAYGSDHYHSGQQRN